MQQQNQINLTIAGFNITLLSNSLMELEEGYLPFVVEEKINNDITVQCFAGIPDKPFRDEELVFEAKNETQRFYSIYRVGKELGFIIYNQQTGDEIQQIAILDESFTSWKTYSEGLSDGKILPLRYPLGPIMMHYMTLKTDAVMMHASCAYDGKKGRIFTGFSGVGKSTMSKLWSEAGNGIVNDDRIIIRKEANGYMVYNTPMYYKDRPKQAPLNSIFLISHSPENKIQKLTGAQAISNVMAFSIQNNFDKQFIQNRLNFFSDLCSAISVYKLGFVPNESVVPFILAHET